jgi:predicted secreted hydrolase
MSLSQYHSVLTLMLLVLLSACNDSAVSPAASPALNLSGVLGGDATAGYLRAEAPRPFSFPADHGPHPGFRNEWWYLTGNLATAQGRRFGYQVTFFNAALPAAEAGAAATSAWHSERLWMAHFALTDIEGGEHHAVERFARENPGLAGATAAPFRVWLEDWRLASSNDAFPWELNVADGNLALVLELQSAKPPVLQGEAGLSRKSPAPGHASYYYSLTRLQTTGELRVGNEVFTVTGTSWLDREWSTSALAPDQSGWDWFSLQFVDNQELMYYQLRDTNGNAHPSSLGNWTDRNAGQTLITPQDIALRELDAWTSPAGITYTTAWQLQYAGQTWQVRALLDEQWMNLTIPYWEGAVVVLDQAGEVAGRGYLEMVRE